jgi:PHD/YefM family antitoxin component YafN of YafNO toxin-antitoxin module
MVAEVNIMATGIRYLVDEHGRKKGVLLDLKEYSRLLARMEELEDALDLDEAIRTAKGFRDYREIREELVKEGR